ncbi:hypothetical protein TRFO_33851 [Tritrichomonas foetus]|uniref:BTB domain-containing protein n=1 Tax=Tritrichomonas foetus TaxID=1144522 RepID=A0A1J4JMG5_9EUKA|nr:hypothetical protein TRFO_33851 [Tritrichomonas foetus]|eukprot:OHS99623.1 hypothetical protein TRFO_33851 [Tritrichomonas foetus]
MLNGVFSMNISKSHQSTNIVYSSSKDGIINLSVNPILLSKYSDYFCQLYFPEKLSRIKIYDKYSKDIFKTFIDLCQEIEVKITQKTLFKLDKLAIKWRAPEISHYLNQKMCEITDQPSFCLNVFQHQIKYKRDIKISTRNVAFHLKFFLGENFDEKNQYLAYFLDLDANFISELFKLSKKLNPLNPISDIFICSFFMNFSKRKNFTFECVNLLKSVEFQYLEYSLLFDVHEFLIDNFKINILSVYLPPLENPNFSSDENENE